jgi:hypothetical protein
MNIKQICTFSISTKLKNDMKNLIKLFSILFTFFIFSCSKPVNIKTESNIDTNTNCNHYCKR